MNRDGVKTVIGLLIIGLIIVATFLYGNSQRQAQLRHDEELKRQQEITVTQKTPQASVQAANTPTPKASATPKPATSTKAQPSVATASPNPIQGQGSKATPTPKVTPASQASPSQTTVADSSSTPKTGPDAFAPVALLALIGSGVYYRRSRRELASALVATNRR